jgi:hypothetical protein
MSRIPINPSIDSHVSSFLTGDDLKEAKRQLVELSLIENKKASEAISEKPQDVDGDEPRRTLNQNKARMLRAKNGSRQSKVYHAGEPEIDPEPRHSITSQEATALLEKGMAGFFKKADEWSKTKETTAPRCLMLAKAGTGKTTCALNHIKADICEGRLYGFFAPTIDLCDQVVEKAREIDLPAMTVRGREQVDPHSRHGDKMCLNSDNAKAVANLGYSITETLCKNKNDGECQFFAECGYNKQKEILKTFSGIVVGPHNYLHHSSSVKSDSYHLMVVDETHDQHMNIDTKVNLEELFNYTRITNYAKNDIKREFQEILNTISNVFFSNRNRQLTIRDFIDANVTVDMCMQLRAYEFSLKPDVEINPSMSVEQQTQLLSTLKGNKTLKFARVWLTLAEQIGKVEGQIEAGLKPSYRLQTINRIFNYENKKTGRIENILNVYYSKTSTIQDIPLLLIDGSANIFSAKKFWNVADEDIISINPKFQNDYITQISSQTFSHLWLSNHKNSDAVFELALATAIECELPLVYDTHTSERMQEKRGVLIVPKGIKEKWIDSEKYNELDNSLPFQIFTWGALRGLDNAKKCSFLISVGRTEPTVSDIEAISFSQHGNDLDDLVLIEEDEYGEKNWIKKIAYYKLKNGTRVSMEVNSHPDPRVNRILEQKRDDEVLQGIARCRPIHRDAENPVKIIIATNLVLDIEIDELAKWPNVEPSKTQHMINHGFLPVNANTAFTLDPNLYTTPQECRKDRSRTVFKCAKNEFGEELSFAEIIQTSYAGYKNIFRVDYKKQGQRGPTNEIAFIVQKYEHETAQDMVARVSQYDARAYDIRLTGLAGENADATLPVYSVK